MKIGKLLIGSVVAVLVVILMSSNYVMAQYRGSNLYFGGESVSGGETLPNGSWVSRINSGVRPYYPDTNGVRESGVRPLAGYESIDPYGSAGYVMPNKQSSGGYALGVLDGGGAIGTRALNNMSEAEKTNSSAAANKARKLKLYNFLESKNKNGTKWERMGSAHVVHQMLGHTAPWGESNFTISSGDWTTLKNRLVENPRLWMVYVSGQSVPNNTAGVQIGPGANPRIDVIDDNNPATAAVWAFREGASPTSSNNVYMLEIICANPIGNLDGLPPYTPPVIDPIEYSLTPTLNSPANGDTVKRNRSITASGAVINSGDPAGPKNWYISRYKAGASSGTKTGACVGLPGSGCVSTGFSHNFTAASKTDSGSMSAFTIPNTAQDGDRYCWIASVRNPTHNATPTSARSDTHCVTVSFKYSLTPSIAISTTGPVDPGGNVAGTSRVTNPGGDTSDLVTWRVTRFIYSSSATVPTTTANTTDPCAAFAGEVSCASVRNATNQQITSSGVSASVSATIPAGTAAGSRVCLVTSVTKPTQNSTTSTWRHSDMKCVTLRSYSLTPHISLDRDDDAAVEPGSSGAITVSVTHGGGDVTREVEWRITEYVYNENSTLSNDDKKAQTSSANRPCVAFTNANRDDCSDDPNPFWSVTRTFPRTPPAQADTPGPSNLRYNVPSNEPIGTKICYVASVSRPTANNSPLWRHSAMVCVVIGKKPKIQLWGGDVRSGGGVTTSISTIQSRTYGSWVEYAALSKMRNVGLASGAGLNDGHGNSSQSSWSRLTFANTGIAPSCTFGCYNFSVASAALAGQFIATSENTNLTGTRDVNNLVSGVYRATGNLNLSATTLERNKTIVIVASGTVTIQGDITYEDRQYTNIRELPQLIIKAPTINIRNAAENVDAWLLAVENDENSPNYQRGTLNTCSDVAVTASLTNSICDNGLTVNGPVAADIVHLRRTAGSENTVNRRGNPAEIFNLRADAYLWGSAYGSRTNQIQTVYSKELSPRF